jgi:hypothetical protein
MEKKYNNDLNRDMVRNFSISLGNNHGIPAFAGIQRMVVKYDLPRLIGKLPWSPLRDNP